MSDYGLKTTPNPERQLTIEVDGQTYYRYPIRVPMVSIGDSYIELINKYALPEFKEEDSCIVLSEKVISICQKRVVHQSEVQPSWLAKLICKYVTKYPNDVGFENPRKMQVGINQAGYIRTILAVAIGGIAKFLFKKRGIFYVIMGNGVAEIDGFNPIAVAPFNEYAILGPEKPNETAQEIQEVTNIPSVIVDASNVATKVLGKSKNVPFTDLQIQQLLLGNPMGQGREQTPIILITKNKR